MINENCTLLDYYAASSGNFLTTFRDDLSFPFSGFKNSWTLKLDPTGHPETSVTIYHYSLRNNPEEYSSDFRGGSLQSFMMISY